MMSFKNFDHINIPFDELELFNQPQKNEMFLVQTLLFTTRINLHVGKHKYNTSLIITKHHIWFMDEKKRKNIFALPALSLLALIKSQQFPQMVFVTGQPYDNVRISCSNQQRCMNIISGVSFLFTKILRNFSSISVFVVRENTLKQFQKTYGQKLKQDFMGQMGRKYVSLQVVYKQKQKREIYGELDLQNKRIHLMKLVYSSSNHMIHVAKLTPSKQSSQSNNDIKTTNPSTNSTQNYYYLHTLEKTQEILQQLRNYQPLPYEELTQELVFVRELDYKVQLFFRYLPQVPKEGSPYYNYQLTPERLFISLMHFYDVLLIEYPDTVLDFELLCYERVTSQQKDTINIQKDQTSTKKQPKHSFRLNQQYSSTFTEITLKLRQFRYQFLLTSDNQLKKLIYQCYYQKNQLIHDPQSWKSKFYHLALLLYEFLYGKEYFSSELQPEVILKMKQQKKVVFPKYLDTESSLLMSYQLQDFIQKSIKLKFKSLQDVYQHAWMKDSVLILAYQQSPIITITGEDKKTDATKSF